MSNLEFRILEQHDGRYIVVLLQQPKYKDVTIIPWESDVRSTSTCYSEISEFVVSSGEYLDNAIRIVHIQFPPKEV